MSVLMGISHFSIIGIVINVGRGGAVSAGLWVGWDLGSLGENRAKRPEGYVR